MSFFAAATTFVATHVEVIITVRALLLDQLAAADVDVLTDPAALRDLTAAGNALLASGAQQVLT
ncbi:hypothetical protein [Mycolicibacterium llatzerense]|uniref:hypothetical protein n=1 Tax=Mycolicibacterium llatzerense TaxID=280871 RepID=UPI0008DE28C7|nr:hypothetical protein [Mycolicibacterium llatzerense]